MSKRCVHFTISLLTAAVMVAASACSESPARERRDDAAGTEPAEAPPLVVPESNTDEDRLTANEESKRPSGPIEELDVPTEAADGPARLEEEEEYELNDFTELSFRLLGVTGSGTIGEGGRLIWEAAEFSQFICNGTVIDVNNHKIEDGFIDTKEYGLIKVVFRGGSLADVYLKPSQKAKFLKSETKDNEA